MIFKRQQNYTYTPPKKPMTKGQAVLYIIVCIALFVLGFFSAYPIMSLIR